MATVQQGPLALVFHAPSADITLAGQSLVGAIIIGEVGFQPTASESRTKNTDGTTCNISTWDKGAEVTLSVMPCGTTAANAVTANGYFPEIGDKCVVVNAAASTTYTDGDFSAASTGRHYRVKAASKTSRSGEPLTWSVTIERVDSIADMTALS